MYPCADVRKRYFLWWIVTAIFISNSIEKKAGSWTLAQNSNGRIAVGSSLTAGEVGDNPWLCPSGDFGFGFKQLQDEDQFLLSIWYDKIPFKTVLWYANDGVSMPRGSRVELSAQSGLVLRDPTGQPLWNSTIDRRNQTDDDHDVGYGFLNDTGNFVLVASSNSTYRLWESFKHPTDTLLPSQEMEIGGMLISRRSETDFSQGRFYLRMLEDGNLVLSTKSRPHNMNFDTDYYSSQTSDAANETNSGLKVIFDEEGYLDIVRKSGARRDLTTSSRSILPTSDYYQRVTLTFDGVVTQYYHPRRLSGNPNWTAMWSLPDNICINIMGNYGTGPCGFNSICRLGNFRRPDCQCPPGYSLLDPNDAYSGCKPNFAQACDEADERGTLEDVYGFETLLQTDWPTSEYEELKPTLEAECKNSCLHDCFCVVAMFRDDGCWKKKLPLSNGRIDTYINVTSFLKYRKHPFSGPKEENNGRNLVLVGSILLGTSLFIIVAGCLGFFLIYQTTRVSQPKNSAEINLRCFSFRELEEATNGFKEELGRGALGIVYKGVIQLGSRSTVAVKKLDSVAQDTEKEFRAKVNIIGQTHHKNLVRLIGFCDEGQHCLLVYEYMRNGTLANFLFGDRKPSWSKSTQIAQGVAGGLTYLHEECRTQIIHYDIKPQNILLDDYYNAQISDFGLAKPLIINQSRTDTGIRGPKSYVAPEWFRNTEINAKVDVYSFGVLLLEIISCRKSLEILKNGGEDRGILTGWAWDCFQDGRLDDLVGNDMEALNDGKKLERFVRVGIWCIQEDSSSRPTMGEVSQMLEGVVEVSVPPCPFPFSSAT